MSQPTCWKKKEKIFSNLPITNPASLITGPQTCHTSYRNPFYRENTLAEYHAGALILIKGTGTPSHTSDMSYTLISISAQLLAFILTLIITVVRYTDKNLQYTTQLSLNFFV